MLDVPHLQVVFTLPSELRGVAHRNPTVVYPLMARAGASVLANLAEQRFGTVLGITTVLHTWASNLTLHAHWHALVTAGGLPLDGQRWVETRTDFLFPVAVIIAARGARFLFTDRATPGLVQRRKRPAKQALGVGEAHLPPVLSAKRWRTLRWELRGR